MKHQPALTKSKYISGVQCPAYLWLLVNDPSKIPELNDEAKKRMEDGIIIGEMATKMYPGGIKILEDKTNLSGTISVLKERKPLFEPGFQYETSDGNIYARLDILIPIGKDEWDIIEVKSGTKVKPINLHDVAFQKYVCEKAGLKIRKCFLCNINKEFVKDGEIKPKDFFVLEDVDDRIEEQILEVEDRIKSLFNVMNLKKCPKVTKEDIIATEYSNIAVDEFFDSLPEKNVFDIYRLGKKKALELYEQGVIKIKDLPEDFKLNYKQHIQRVSTNRGEPHIDKKKIGKFLDTLEYPLYYLDFETFSTAIPMLDKTKPYQQIPFQYSLHVVEKKGAEPKHISYLADCEDPREEFTQSLKDNLGDKGSIVVYYESFEKGRITECIEAFPEFLEWGKGILDRFVDLYRPFGDFHYHHHKQKGSSSLKDILPVFSKDVKYSDLLIQNGADASLSYYKSHFGEGVSAKEKSKIREALEKYCELDTYAEVLIVEGLMEIVK